MSKQFNQNKGNQNKGNQNPKVQNIGNGAKVESVGTEDFMRPEEENDFVGKIYSQKALQTALANSLNKIMGGGRGKRFARALLKENTRTNDENVRWKFEVAIDTSAPIFQSRGGVSPGKKLNSLQKHMLSSKRGISKAKLNPAYVDLIKYLEYEDPYHQRNEDRLAEDEVSVISNSKDQRGITYNVIELDFFRVLAILLDVPYEAIQIIKSEKRKEKGKKGKYTTQMSFALAIFGDMDDFETDFLEEDEFEDMLSSVTDDDDEDDE